MKDAPPRLTNAQWARLAPIIDELDPYRRGHPRTDPRLVLDTLLYRGATGCAWNRLPAWCGDDSTVLRTVQRWRRRGVLERVYAALVRGTEKRGAA